MSNPTAAFQSDDIMSADGTRLHFEARLAVAPRGHLLFVHGFAEHCGRYESLSETCVDAGYSAYHFDYRGHGRSDGKRGHIFRFQEYLEDFTAFRSQASSVIDDDAPVYVLAHSYGGLISASALSRDSGGISGVILSSPFFGFAVKIPRWKSVAGHVLSRYIPSVALPTDIDPSIVSHDPATIAEYGEDPLIGRVASARWLTETEDAHEALRASAAGLTIPVLLQQAGEDKLVDKAASQTVFDLFSAQDKTYREYADQYHELWFELDRAQMIGDALDWLTERSDSNDG